MGAEDEISRRCTAALGQVFPRSGDVICTGRAGKRIWKGRKERRKMGGRGLVRGEGIGK